MVSFVIKKGLLANLNSVTPIDGQILYCTDTNELYIDYKSGSLVVREQINLTVTEITADEITALFQQE